MARKKKQSQSLLPFLIWLLLMSFLLVSTARGDNRALLVGVGRFANFDETLNGVNLDLAMMTECARLLGFKNDEIKVLANEQASAARVHAAIENWLIEGTGPEDRVLIYFSGHGSQIPDENGDEDDRFDEVLVLFDVLVTQSRGRPSLSGVLVDDELNRMLARMRSRNILIILDACHSGSATRRLHLSARSFQTGQAKGKYFYYSPSLEAAGEGGSFDIMTARHPLLDVDRYVAIAACRDDEKTIATSQGSIFTLGLRHALRSAAAAGESITPEELQNEAANFIREQVRSDTDIFHPQIAGSDYLRRHPFPLVSTADGNGFVRNNLQGLVHKSSQTVWLELNKTCYTPGEALKISVWIPEPGYLNILQIGIDDRVTVLFPNRYHPRNHVAPGKISLPGRGMDFELTVAGPRGRNLIAAFLTRSEVNAYRSGFRTAGEFLAELSPNATRALMLGGQSGSLAAGSVTAEVGEGAECR